MRYGFCFALLAVCFVCTTGFKESTRLIKVQKDGTGVIHVRVLFNPALLPENAVVFDEAKLKEDASKYGLGVRYIAGKDIKAENGWRGFIAKYSFYDVSRLEILPDTLPPDIDREGAAKRGWKFTFAKPDKPDGAAILKIMPRDAAADEGDEGDDAAAGDDDDDDNKGAAAAAAEDDDDDAAAVTEEEETNVEVRRQLRGRRHVTYLQVEGKIAEAGEAKLTPYRSQKFPETLILDDEQWEVMWRNPEARKLLKMEDPDITLLANRKIPGLRILNKKLAVRFQ